MIAIPVLGNIELLARRRGLGRLISQAMEGDPTSIAILSVIVVGFIGYLVFKARSGGD